MPGGTRTGRGLAYCTVHWRIRPRCARPDNHRKRVTNSESRAQAGRARLADRTAARLIRDAYLPQITHLIRARCSAGMSRLAFGAWLLSSVLLTVRAVAIHAGVFVVLGGIQIAATALIMLYTEWYRGMACPAHALSSA